MRCMNASCHIHMNESMSNIEGGWGASVNEFDEMYELAMPHIHERFMSHIDGGRGDPTNDFAGMYE